MHKASLIEDNTAIVDLKVDTNDTNDNSNHEVTDREDENSIEGSDSSNGNIAEHDVPKKKTKKELSNPKLSQVTICYQ